MDELELKAINELKKIISDVLGIEISILKRNMTARDIKGWDSLAHVRILHNCESKLGISLTFEEISKLEEVGDLIDIIKKYI
tara:strand:- start:1371 stop:1616 length:246 start_codon:yes stop_codon:yes gene_type:complete